jgi:hypothetical protein
MWVILAAPERVRRAVATVDMGALNRHMGDVHVVLIAPTL